MPRRYSTNTTTLYESMPQALRRYILLRQSFNRRVGLKSVIITHQVACLLTDYMLEKFTALWVYVALFSNYFSFHS